MSRELDVQIKKKIFGWSEEVDGNEYSSDLNAAYEVEEKIKEMGLEKEYIMELIKVFDINYLMVKPIDFYNMAHASAEDRCKAALKAVEGKMI